MTRRWRPPTRAFLAGALLVGVLTVVPGFGGFPNFAAPAAAARSETARLAAANRRSEPQIRQILDDPTAKVGAKDHIFYEEPLPAQGPEAAPPDAPEQGAPYPEADTFLLHSRPGSSRVIYLDFDGSTIAGRAWNEYARLSSFVAEPFSLDAAAAFSSAEQDVIQRAWQRVAEDFSPFDVDVTTEDPGEAALSRSSASDLTFGTRALITNTATIATSCGCAGIAYLGAFGDPYLQPALVFSRGMGSPKLVAETISHEVGHNVNLAHDRTGSTGYYSGHGSWAPIMGLPFYRPITQWSKGEFPGSANTEDDFQLMQSIGVPLLADDHGDTSATASVLPSRPSNTVAGLITTDADVDVFRVRGIAGAAIFSASPAPEGPNLDIVLELRSADGAVLGRSDPPSGTVSAERASGLDASLALTLTDDVDYFVSVTGVGTGDTSTGYTGYGSLGRYTLTANVNVPTVSLTSSLSPATIHDPVTFTSRIAVPPPGLGTPTGSVTFEDSGIALCPAVAVTDAEASCTATLRAGNRDVVAVYSGDDSFATASSSALSFVVEGDPVAVALTTSPGSTVSGQTVAFEAVVAGLTPDAPTPTGAVTLRDGTALRCGPVALSAGVATCSTALATGSHPLSAVYTGDDRFGGGTSPVVTHVTNRSTSAVDARSSVNPSVAGQSAVLSTTVTVLGPGRAQPVLSGTVTFRGPTGVVCTATVSYWSPTTSCQTALNPGSHVITAEYSGDVERDPSTSLPFTQIVNRAAVDVVLTSSPNPSSSGQNVRIRAPVAPRWPGWSSPTGTVSFTEGGATLCADVVVTYGEAICNRALLAGRHELIATYGGDDRITGGSSPPLNHDVGAPAVTVGLFSSANPVERATPVTLEASVAPVVSGTTPTGTVTFTEGATTLCGAVTLLASRARCTLTLRPGSHRIVSTYSGDSTFALATSAVITQTVLGDPVKLALSLLPASSVSGQAVVLSATVTPTPPDGAVPTGAVTFFDSAREVCRAEGLGGGTATCVLPLSSGTHRIEAKYLGDERFGEAWGERFHQVELAQTTVAVRASETQPVDRPAQLNATVTVSAPGEGVPTGMVTFKDGAIELCTLPVGVTCERPLRVGTHPITATYGGDGQLAGATSPVFDQVILNVGDGFTAVTPNRLLDTRTGLGSWAGPLDAGATRSPVVRGGTTGIPDTATSVMLNVTATGPTAESYLTVYPSGTPRPDTSSLNLEVGRTVPNLVPVVVGADGRVNITNAFGRVHVIVDIVGYYTRTGGSPSTAITPTRLLDTRVGTGGPAAPITGGTTRQLTVRGGATGVPDTATAVIVNMTVTQPTVAGFLTVHPSGVAIPNASSLNFAAGETVPNLVVARIGADGRISIFNAYGTAHVLADVVGYYAPTSASTYTAVPGRRLLDTRTGTGGPAVPIGPGALRQLTVAGIPADATAVVLNLTVVSPSASSYLTVFGGTPPNASNLNYGPGQTRANLVVTRLGPGGTVSIFNEAGHVHVLADIVGYTR